MELYIAKEYIKDFTRFRALNGNKSSQVICNMISNYINLNINLHIPSIRKTLTNNPDEVRRLRELLKEFD